MLVGEREEERLVSTSELIWPLALLAALSIALLVFKRVRRRTRDFAESAAFKQRLPSWVRLFELAVAVAFLIGGVLAVTWLFFRLAPGAMSCATR
jgi:hypothetical protein